MTQRVIVVGAGVIGLSCAVRLAEAGFDTHVLARELPLETTSAVAGALWFPYRAEPADAVARWARATLAELLALHRAESETGVLLREGVLLHHAPPQPPAWSDALRGLVDLHPVVDPAPGYRHGLAARVPLVDMGVYLPCLRRRLERAGGTVTRMPLPALPERGIVVDATGVSARAMANDPSVHPVRGQVLVVENPGVHRWLVDEHEAADGGLTYVLPRTDTVVVGGCAVEDDWDPLPRPELADAILRRAVEVEPRLRGVRVLAHRVGLRPARPTVRLEAEQRGEGTVVHCYGHGGAGVTLSWGCADDVLALVQASAQR
ncbi:MAG: FAD-dependent oxidoreductase [Actinomycetes bacterium]